MWAWLLRLWGVVSIGFLITGFHTDHNGWIVHVFAICAWIASDAYFLLMEKKKPR